jgi:hypothetical protein
MNMGHAVRRPAVLLLAMLVVAAALAAVASAGGSKTFKVVITPASVPAGSASVITATVTNASDPQGVGSANLTAPTGWTATTVSTSKGTATVAGQVVQLRNLALMPGASAAVNMTTNVPCGSGSGVYTVRAKQANDFNGTGNDVALDTGASDLSIDRSGSCRLRFVTQPPSDVKSGQAFTTSVEVIDGSGNRATTSTAPISLAATGATLGGPSSATAAGGLATFSGVNLTAPDATPATLTASSPAYGTTTSNTVTVHGDYTACDPNVECQANETFTYQYLGVTRRATFSLRALSDPDASRLLIDQFLVPNPTTADPGCAGDDLPQPVIARFLGVSRALEYVQTVDGSLTRSASLGDTLFYGGPLKACVTLPYSFPNSTAVGTIDGKPAYRGLLQTCSFLGVIPFRSTPCIESQYMLNGDYAMKIALPDSSLDPYSR